MYFLFSYREVKKNIIISAAKNYYDNISPDDKLTKYSKWSQKVNDVSV